MKQKMAAFLAVCMVASSLPTGPAAMALGAEQPEENASEAASLIQFDTAKLKEAVDEAIKGDLVSSPTIVASASDAELPTNFNTNVVYELKSAEKLLAAGTELPEKTELRIFLEPDNLEDGEEYILTGRENLTFMIENKGSETQAYQLVFGNKATSVIEVKSKDQLWKEYEIAAEEEAEGTTASASNAEETTQESQTVETTPVQAENDPTATLPAESSEAKDETAAESAAAAETEAVTEEAASEAEEMQAPEIEEEAVEEEAEEAIVIENEAEEAESETEEKDSSVTLGSIADLLTGTIVARAEEMNTASPSNAQETTEAAEDKTEEETAAPAEEETTVPAAEETTVAVEETEEATPSQAEEIEEENKTFESSLDGYVLLDASISASVLIESGSISKSAAEEADFGPMAMRMARANVNTLSDDVTEDDSVEVVNKNKVKAVALASIPVASVTRASNEPEVSFNINLYNYSNDEGSIVTDWGRRPTGKNYQNSGPINNYLGMLELENENGDALAFGGGDDQAADMNSYRINNKCVNIYQEIPDAVGGIDKLVQALFPAEQPDNEEAIKAYTNVNATGLFDYDASTQTYSYSSDDNGVTFTPSGSTGTLTKDDDNSDGGFWPFNGSETVRYWGSNYSVPTSDWYFGMSLSFDFFLPAGGVTNTGDDMVFNFSGDDDVWVYLTEKDNPTNKTLVLDLGGIHGKTSGSIDFAHKTVTYWQDLNNEPTIYNSSRGEYTVQDNRYTKSIPMELKDDTVYTLEFYYLERGGTASNCVMEFNLAAIPESNMLIRKSLQGNLDLVEETDTYWFNVVSADSVADLVAYRTNPADNMDRVIVSDPATIVYTGSATVSTENYKEYPFFYVEEKITNSATSDVGWTIAGDVVQQTGENTGTGTYEKDGAEYRYSSIYEAKADGTDQDVGILVDCVNHFGDVKPDYAKRAWKNWNETDKYDLTLEVTGNEIKSTSSTEGSKPIDLVIVVDKSGSMMDEQSDGRTIIQGVKDAILAVADQLAIGSNLSIVAFSDDDITRKWVSDGFFDGHYIYSADYTYAEALNENGDVYFRTVTDWYSISDETSKTQLGNILKSNFEESLNEGDEDWWGNVTGSDITGGTHAGGGLLGAQVKLASEKIADSTNQKVVIFMTDGEPTYAIDEDRDVVGNGGSASGSTYESIIKICRDRLQILNGIEQNPQIFALDYGTTGREWLDPDYVDQDGNTPNKAVDKYYNPDSLETLLSDMNQILTEVTSSTELSDVTVTDKLSDYVGLSSISVNGTSVLAPDLYVMYGTVSGTNEIEDDGVPAQVDKSLAEHLSPFAYENGVVQYCYENDEAKTVIAKYVVDSKTITWYVGREAGQETNNLGKETRTLIYEVTALTSTDEKVQSDPDTGTHANDYGYHSNDEAKISYNDGTGTKTEQFPHPVVVPSTGSLTIVKAFDGIDTGESELAYEFSIDFDSDSITAPDTATKFTENVDEGHSKYSFTLTNQEDKDSIIFTDIPLNTAYTIVEESGPVENISIVDGTNEVRYALTGVSAKIDGEEVDVTLDSEDVLSASIRESTLETYSSTVEITNEFEAYGSITLTKEVVGTSSENEFSFSVTKDGQAYGDGTYTITASADQPGTITIPVHPDDVSEDIVIEESNDGAAWKTEVKKNSETSREANSITAKTDDTVIFTNYYYTHTLAIEKQVNAPEGVGTNKTYTFTVDLTVAENEMLTEEEVKSYVTSANSEKVGQLIPGDNNHYSFDVTLGDDESIIFNLPQKVKAYTVSETVNQGEVTGYNLSIENITVSDDKDLVGEPTYNDDKLLGSVSGTFADKADQSVEITYTNKYVRDTDELTIVKNIDQTDTSDQTFVFKIKDNGSDVYYAAVTIPAGDREASTTITLPTGEYTIEEVESSVRYQFESVRVDGGQAVEENLANVVVGTNKTVTFTNTKTSDSYFSDTASKINELQSDGHYSAGSGNDSTVNTSALAKVGAFLLPDNKIKPVPWDGDDMLQPA